MRASHILPFVCVFLLGVSTLFEGENNGKIGALTDDLSSKASDAADAPEPSPTALASANTAKVSVWGFDDQAPGEDPEFADTGDDGGYGLGAADGGVSAGTPFQAASPVHATAGAMVAPEQMNLKER